jgi:DNA-3-methyladenine glycosylase II
LVIWFLSLHSPSYNFCISPQKVSGQSSEKRNDKDKGLTILQDRDELPIFGLGTSSSNEGLVTDVITDVPSVPSANSLGEPERSAIVSIPPAFTPSIKTTLNKPAVEPGSNPIPLPDGLSVAVLKSRLEGKKKIKYALSPLCSDILLIHCLAVEGRF